MNKNINNNKQQYPENCHVVAYKKNYRAQVESLQEYCSFLMEFLDKANLSSELTKKLIHKFGEFREVFLARGRDNRNAYFSCNNQINNLMEIIELLKEKNKRIF